MKSLVPNSFFNLNFDSEIISKSLPKNIYAIELKDFDNEVNYLISIEHNGFCPTITNEREQSNFNDYLSSLENTVVTEFFKSKNMKKPKRYFSILEVLTNSNGELFHYSKTTD